LPRAPPLVTVATMPRTRRIAPGGIVFHCINRGNDGREIFGQNPDYAAFERVLDATLQQVPVRLLAYCLMPNHWHLVLWPRKDGELATFMQRLTTMHVRRWHRHRKSDGRGHLYQGTYKSFPIQADSHLRTVARYVERNALRVKLVERAEQWQWCSLWRRERGSTQELQMLTEWPVSRRRDWVRWVNEPQSQKELAEIADSLKRGRPFGDPDWQYSTADKLNLQATFRPRGRPKRQVAPH
jgi:putative transposase